MGSAILSYRNFCFDTEASIANSVGTFQAGAPLTNLLTPRLGQLAIASNIGASNVFTVTLRPGSPSVGVPVRLIGLLNHNIVDTNFLPAMSMYIQDIHGRTYTSSNPDNFVFSYSDGSFQNHAFLVIPADATDLILGPLDLTQIASATVNIPSTVICGTLDHYTSEVTRARFQAGALWAGPILQPSHGISLEGFGQSVADNSRVLRSIGGQVWTDPELRQRTGTVEFAGLLEAEVYALAPEQSLQQLAIYCGLSRPLIVLPVSDNDDLSYLQGIYGYLMSVPKWATTEKVKVDGVQKRLYTGSLEIMEAR